MSDTQWIERTGVCQCCGQIGRIRINRDATDAECDKEATRICDCPDARKMQAIEQSIVCAQKAIEEDYKSAPHVQKVLMAAVADIGHGVIDKITVSQGKSKYTMSRTKQGAIKTEKVTTTKEIKES